MIARQHNLVTADGTENRIALFSDCERFRYLLSIIWNPSAPFMQVIGLNPSTATELKDDPTVRKCKTLARKWGYGGLSMTNLFAFRATNPDVLKKQTCDVTGDPDNLIYITAAARKAELVIAAWGVHGIHQNRGAVIANKFPGMKCFRLTKHGHPEHPLYLPLTIYTRPFN